MGNTILADRYVPGMRVVHADSRDVAGTLRVLSADFTCATDPVFHFDGGRLAFAGRQTPRDRMQIWEFASTDEAPHVITSAGADCVSPVYLPNGRLLVASIMSGEYEEHGGMHAFSLYVFDPTDEEFTRLTFNPSSDFDPAILPDGRIAYSSWQHVGNHHWPTGTVAIMLINWDGTGVFPLTGNHRKPWLKRSATPIGNDRIAFVQSDGHRRFGAGALMATSLNDALADYEVLIPGDAYEVAGVSPFPDGALLVSARPTKEPRTTFGLYVLRDDRLTLLFDDPAFDELCPAVGGATALPQQRISTVVPDTEYGFVAILNCYDSDRTAQSGRTAIAPGSIKAVRLIEGLPTRHERGSEPTFLTTEGREDEPMVRPNSATGHIPSRILGEVPLAEDGSAYLKVPADKPLRIQLLDRDGFAIMNERAWFWVRPNERRACIGCHENRELSPHNATPLATRRAPTDLTDAAQWHTVSFVSDIQPILQRTCAVSGCHMPPTPTAGMNLTADQLNGDKDSVLSDRFGPAYANLLKRQDKKPFSVGGRRVHPGNAKASPMIWMLYGRALTRQYKPAPFERPMLSAHPGPMLPEAQLELIRKWIDLGAHYDDSAAPGPWPYKIPPAGAMARVNGQSDDQ